MLKWITAPFGIAMLMAMFAPPLPARAETLYPWCAEYAGREDQATNCGFVTMAQCMATISGIGGRCYENPAYGVAAPKPKRQRG